MRSRCGVLAAVLLGGLVGFGTPLWAQGRTVSGTVKDSLTGEGIEAARVIEDTNDRPVPWKRGGETDA